MKRNRLIAISIGLCVCMAGHALLSHAIASPPIGHALLPAGHARPLADGGKLTDTITCTKDPSQSYALYIPAKGNTAALPIIYCFDPHGDGSLPLKKYRTLADSYGFILVGSNNSKNGNDWPTTEKIWRSLFNDTRSRLKLDPARIYTCGFSGGAKVAGYTAIQHPEIKGVIAGGAGLPDGVSAGDFAFSYTALAGEGDMNMTDMVSLSRDLDHTHTRHRLILFDGKHEWAPESTMRTAFLGLLFDAMLQHLTPVNNTLIIQYSSNSQKQVQTAEEAHQLIKAARQCQLSAALLDGLSPDTKWFLQKSSSITARHDYQEEREKQENILATEQRTKEEYMQHFQQENIPYWENVITQLKQRAIGTSAVSSMNQRLLAYLSLAFYSISNQLINTNRNEPARYFVTLYKMADPANSEAWYFSAILDIREGQAAAANSDLQKAAHYGFRDKKRALAQPEFHSQPSLLKLIP